MSVTTDDIEACLLDRLENKKARVTHVKAKFLISEYDLPLNAKQVGKRLAQLEKEDQCSVTVERWGRGAQSSGTWRVER